MSSNDPRLIIRVLEDLQFELERWSLVASETLSEAHYAQNQSKETVDRAVHDAQVILGQAREDEAVVEQTKIEVDEILAQGEAAQKEARHTLDESQDFLNKAQDTLSSWETELAKAEAWLEKAEDRLSRAIEAFKVAEADLEWAERELERAISRLKDCYNDERKKNCNRQEREVRSARDDVEQAQHNLYVAEEEVTAAEEEVAQTQARVTCCATAVGISREAVILAQSAKGNAGQALDATERSLESAEASVKLMADAQSKLLAEIEAAEQMKIEALGAAIFIDEGFSYLRNADTTEDIMQQYSNEVSHEFEYRTQQLKLLNIPSLDGVRNSASENVSVKTSSPFGSSEQVLYGTTDLGRTAIKFRQTNGISTTRNVAVFEYIEDGVVKKVTKASKRGLGHAERLIASELDRQNIDGSQVTCIYSELEPCSVPGGFCKRFIQQRFPQANVTYSFEYGQTSKSRQIGIRQLREALTTLFNR